MAPVERAGAPWRRARSRAHQLASALLIRLFPVLLRATPAVDGCVVHAEPDAEGNGIEVLRALLGTPVPRIYWLVKNVEAAPRWALADVAGHDRIRVRSGGSVRGVAAATLMRVAFHTHGLYGSPDPGSRRVHVNLWHGDGPKRTTNASFAMRSGSTLLVSGCRAFGLLKAADLGTPAQRLLVTGNPRIDGFDRPADDEALRRLGLDPAVPLVLWMPTYRSTAGPGKYTWRDAPSLQERPEVAQMLAALDDPQLRAAVQFRVKPHPLDAELAADLSDYLLTDEELSAAATLLYSLLGRVHVLLTDYSSVWTDFLALDRPIGFFCPDLEDYAGGRGFVGSNPTEDWPGPLLRTGAEVSAFLRAAVSGDVDAPRRAEVAERLGVVRRTGATERLLAAVDERCGGSGRLRPPVARERGAQVSTSDPQPIPQGRTGPGGPAGQLSARARGLAQRLYMTTAAHRSVPVQVELARVRARARRDWAAGGHAHDRAELQLRYLLGACERSGDVESLGEAYLYESYKRYSLRWRPWLLDALAIDGLEHVRAAYRQGGGLLITLLHQGLFAGVPPSLARQGLRLHLPTFLHMLGPEATAGRRRHVDTVGMHGSAVFAAEGSFPYLTGLLERGEIVVMACDLPGSTEVRVLGRSVGWASGMPRLAEQSGSPVVAVSAHPDSWSQRLQLHPPLHAQDYGSRSEFLQALATLFEPSLLAWPEAVEQPMARSRPLGADAERFQAGDGDP